MDLKKHHPIGHLELKMYLWWISTLIIHTSLTITYKTKNIIVKLHNLRKETIDGSES